MSAYLSGRTCKHMHKSAMPTETRDYKGVMWKGKAVEFLSLDDDQDCGGWSVALIPAHPTLLNIAWCLCWPNNLFFSCFMYQSSTNESWVCTTYLVCYFLISGTQTASHALTTPHKKRKKQSC